MKAKIKVLRYGVPMEREADSLEEAMQSAFYDVEYNQASPKEIVLEDGTIYYRAAMADWWEKYNYYDR